MKVFGFEKALPTSEQGAFIAREEEMPVPTGHDILVEIKAVSVNPVDTKVRRGKADDGTFKVAGYDAAGIVVAVGPDVTLFKAGDEVWYAGDVTRPGSNADFHLVDERIVAKKPVRMSFTEAAAMPLTILTAWEALHERLAISRDEGTNKARKLLVINGAGGVGSVAIQLAKRAGVHVTATASRSESRDWCLDLGADEVIAHKDTETMEESAFDWIFVCHNTDDYFDIAARLVKPGGAVCMITGAYKPHNIQALMHKSARLVWEYMFTRSTYQTDDMIVQHQILKEAATLVDAGELRGTLTKVLSPLGVETLGEAHATLEAGGMIGKLVIEHS
jgi:NADPH2:quinone reductase